MTNLCDELRAGWGDANGVCLRAADEIDLLRDQRDSNLAKEVETVQRLNAEIERLRETLNCPTLTPEAPAAQFKAVLDLSEKGEPVNGQDLINVLWWRVRNQKREIARLHATIGGES